jgi:hypothetical protein
MRLRSLTLAMMLTMTLPACTADTDDGSAAPPTTLATRVMVTVAPDRPAAPAPHPRAMGTLGAASTGDDPATTHGETEEAATPSTRLLADLQVGECVDLPGLRDPDTVEVTVAELRDCDEPHDAEVYARISLDDDPAAAYPGDEQVLAAADQVCLDAFEGYVGVRYVDTRLEIVHLRPTTASWARGDRTVVCAAMNAVAGPLVGSVADTAR